MKKSAHILEYAILYFLLFRAVNKFNLKSKKKEIYNWLLPLVFCLLYAASDEFHQSFVPGRTSLARDVGFDFLGMLLVLWLLKNKLKIL